MKSGHAGTARILSLIALPLVAIGWVMLLQQRETPWYEWFLFGSMTLSLLVSLFEKQLGEWPSTILSFLTLVLAFVGMGGLLG